MMWGRSRHDKALAERFVAAFNTHDVDGLAAMMAEDFIYIDSWREGVTGRDRVLAAVRALIATDPEFGIDVESYDWRDPHVLMAGRVRSRAFGDRRALWQLRIVNGQVAEYQAWAEGGPPPLMRMLAPAHVEDMARRAAEKPQLEES